MSVSTFGAQYFSIRRCILTHWSRVTHICVSSATINSAENGLSPGRCQTNIWTNAGMLLIGPISIVQWNLLRNLHNSSRENAFENVVLKMACVLSRLNVKKGNTMTTIRAGLITILQTTCWKAVASMKIDFNLIFNAFCSLWSDW